MWVSSSMIFLPRNRFFLTSGSKSSESAMKDVSKHLGPPAAATNAPRLPAAVDRATWQTELDTLRVREKAHTGAGDAIAAARRRLPMVEVDAATPLTGGRGPVTLLEAFQGRRRQLIATSCGTPADPQPSSAKAARCRS